MTAAAIIAALLSLYPRSPARAWSGGSPVDLRELMCSPDADAAYRAWGDFVAWCAGRGVELPVARVWLVMMEVA